jgi:hypothetical protein
MKRISIFVEYLVGQDCSSFLVQEGYEINPLVQLISEFYLICSYGFEAVRWTAASTLAFAIPTRSFSEVTSLCVSGRMQNT